MSCDRYARMIIKTGQGVPTIPASADHRNGDWIDTDIYEGEQYMDTDTGLVYTRWFNDIIVVGSSASIGRKHLLVSQTGASAPTNIVIEDQLGGGSWSYVGTGLYEYTETGLFPDNKTSIIMQAGVKNGWVKAYRVNSNKIQIATYDYLFAAADGILDDTTLIIEVIP